jgi:hypothetical protein
MNNLVKYGKLEPLIHNGKLISIKLKLNIEGYHGKTIIFKDSMLLLPVSLRKLCEVFKIETVKSYFPFGLSNIFYTGVLPKFEYWSGITPNIYNNLKKLFKNRMWNFQLEAIKYCKMDCTSLHQVLTQFNEFFFNKYQINIHSSLTAPALAMRLFKTHFMPKNAIFQLHGIVEQAIRESYSGGAVDVYIPHNKIGSYLMSRTFRTIKGFDVNSLYPTVMAQQAMPIGLPTVFEGDIRKIEPNAYGFFYCKITSPKFLEHPILQRRINTSDGIRTVAGLGTWMGWICSTEMYNAMKFGYSFEILRGYQFETGDIFSEFINTMYNLRMEFEKSHPMNYIAKLMMNSLYGKFGMRSEFTRVEIYEINTESDKVAFKDLLKIWGTTIKDFVLLESHLIIVRDSTLDLRNNPDQEIDPFHGIETNIAIASAITAGARAYMSLFKNNSKFHLYYSDTDSIFIDGELPESLIGKGLGQLKLEYTVKKAVFLAPKVYALITEDGQEIVKVKGITSQALIDQEINFDTIANLLIQDSTREFTQEKWYKSITKGTITVSDIAYTLKVTSNKRHAVYVDGIYEKTVPYYYDEIENKSN